MVCRENVLRKGRRDYRALVARGKVGGLQCYCAAVVYRAWAIATGICLEVQSRYTQRSDIGDEALEDKSSLRTMAWNLCLPIYGEYILLA